MSQVFGVKITLNDHTDPVVEENTIGLYSITSDLSGNAAADQADVAVDDGSIFAAGDIVNVTDDLSSEEAIIESISTNTLTLTGNLANAYTTANNAKVDGNSVFRWVQNAVTDLTGWVGGMIVMNGIGNWTREIELRFGGNVAFPGVCSVTVKNTDSFYNTIRDKDVLFEKALFQIYEINDTTPTRRWTGFCEKPRWGSKSYDISAIGMQAMTDADMAKKINLADYANADKKFLGKNLPVTLGRMTNTYDVDGNVTSIGLAQCFRVAKENKTLYGTQITDGTSASFDPNEISIFPIVAPSVSSALTLEYTIKVGTSKNNTPSVYPTLTDYYIKVVSGTGEGEYRKISVASFDEDNFELDITIDKYFPETLQGNATATATDQSWVSLVKISSYHVVDHWPCKAFLTELGAEISTSYLELFQLSDRPEVEIPADGGDGERLVVETGGDDEYYRISENSFSILDSDYNSFELLPEYLSKDPETVVSIIFKPCVSPSWFSRTQYLDVTGYDIGGIGENAFRIQPGLYGMENRGVGPVFPNGNMQIAYDGLPENVTNRSVSNHAAATFSWGDAYDAGNPTSKAYLIFEAGLPKISKKLKFDKIYIGINADLIQDTSTPFAEKFNFGFDRWIGNGVQVHNSSKTTSTARAITFPDSYWVPAAELADRYFFVSQDDESYLSGYSSIELTGITTYEKYQELDFVTLIGYANVNNTVATKPSFTWKIYNVAFMFVQNAKLSETLYTAMSGRIFNDTWGARKTAAGLMSNPIDMLEHCCRLQNWAHNSINPTDGWGKNYAANAQIKTTGTGSFDDTTDGRMQYIKTLSVADQFVENTGTMEIKKSICRTFGLANWVDADGKECVKPVTATTTAPATTITLGDIINRNAIEIVEPQAKDIYPEIFVRYSKDYGNNISQKEIRITNVSASTYVDGYVSGYSGAEAEEYWGRCRNLYLKTRQTKIPPSSITDIDWANGPTADEVAWDYVKRFIDWMDNPSIRFNVHYDTAKAWEETTRILINLPHQTGGADVECLITKIEFSPNPPYICDVEAIMLIETAEPFDYRDSMVAFSGANDWQDTMTVYGDDNDKQDVM